MGLGKKSLGVLDEQLGNIYQNGYANPAAKKMAEGGYGAVAGLCNGRACLKHPRVHGAHRQFIDIQMLLKGRSRVEWTLTENLTVEKPFMVEKDYEGLSGEGRFFEAQPFDFYVLYPNDAHKPHCFFAEESEPFQVVIVKVPVEAK